LIAPKSSPEYKTHLELKHLRDGLEQRVRERTEELLQSEGRYRFLTENVSDGVFILRDTLLIFANPAFARIFALPEARLNGEDFLSLLHEKFKTRFKILAETAMKGIQSENFQTMCIRGDSQEIWIEGTCNRIEWNAEPVLLGTLRDITLRKMREIADAAEKERLILENQQLRASVKNRRRLGNIIGKSPIMQDLYDFIMNASKSDGNVFIYGESGVGKELVARTIHEMSGRRDRPFVPVNCSAIPEPLFESEFFGYCKGAFTGAGTDKQGFFDMADSGTLFLDEVAEITAGTQAKLLRALESGGYMPVGGIRQKAPDVRIISATNRDIGNALETGKLREDFFYRLHVFPVCVPPLRERKEDIPLLADYFLSLYDQEKKMPKLTEKIWDSLIRYHWPGNVRELQSAVRRYVGLNRFEIYEMPVSASPKEFCYGGSDLREALAEFEKAFISKLLANNHWHVENTSKMMGIPRRTLSRKMKSLGIKRP
jgi:PAS domain S-box-containing protein